MAPRKPLNTEEIIELLSKLKETTPDYPSDLMAARKSAFLQNAIDIKIDTNGQGGEGGQQGGSSGAGGSGTALGGGATASGTFLQVLIGIGLSAAIFLAAYAYREEIAKLLQGNGPSVREESSRSFESSIASTPAPTESIPSPIPSVLAAPPIEDIATETPVADDHTNITGALVVEEESLVAEIGSEEDKTDNGLHLGQTPGAPAVPGKGNPGNPNKPDKPDKPEKPDKPKK